MKRHLTFLLLTALMTSGLCRACQAGNLEGTVVLKSSLAKRQIGKKKSDAPEDSSGYKGDTGKTTENELENVVVYLEGPGLKATPLKSRSKANTLFQQNKEFRPHVLAITKGTTVYFENQDPFAHHVYSESKPGEFEIRKHTTGVRTQVFDETAVVETFCGIHTKMNCYILVLDNDFFRSVDGNGHFTIPNVPGGTYKLTA